MCFDYRDPALLCLQTAHSVGACPEPGLTNQRGCSGLGSAADAQFEKSSFGYFAWITDTSCLSLETESL